MIATQKTDMISVKKTAMSEKSFEQASARAKTGLKRISFEELSQPMMNATTRQTRRNEPSFTA